MTTPITAYPSVVANNLKHFKEFFSKPQMEHFAQYLTGLIVSDNRTIQGINDNFVFRKDQSNLNRFLTESDWDEEGVERKRIELIKQELEGMSAKNGALYLDDTLCHKRGEKIEGVGKYYDSANNTYTLGHNLVTSQLTIKGRQFPLGFRRYQKYDESPKGFKTKIDLAFELVQDAVKEGHPFCVVCFDKWYFSKKFTRRIERLGKDWVTQCKSNRKVVINNQRVSVGEWLKNLPAEKFKRSEINDEIYYCFQKVCLMSKQGWVKVIAYHKREDLSDDLVILVSNRLDWDERKVIGIYQGRWSIETFYEDSKQNLGLEDYEMRKLRGITRHWYLVFLAYTLLQLSVFDRTLRRWLKANIDTIGEKCRFTATEIVKAFILFVLRLHELKYDTKEVITLLYLPRAKLKIVPISTL
jgi:SRSO17 transposase